MKAFEGWCATWRGEENKEIDFRLSGSGVRADRIVLQALKDPVMHLLRNAISHGIETPGERASKGKSPVGSLILRLDSQRGRLIVEVEDDGRGVDLKQVDQRALRGRAGAHSADELARAIFRPGFSTSATVNHLSGRGMGLSVVYETVHRLQGDVNLRPKESPGASFLLSVPLSVSTSHLLLLSAAGQTFGIPTHGIERLYRIRLERVETLEGKPVVNLEGQAVPLYGLAHLLQIGDALPALPRRHAAGDGVEIGGPAFRCVGGRVPDGARRSDSGTGNALPGQRQHFRRRAPAGRDGVRGLEPGRFGRQLHAGRPPLRCPRRAQAQAPAIAPGILVVDDSITSRSLERSILEAHGYRVRVAVDGLEALELLRAEKADLIITDIQMPRMDGFGLVEALKADPGLKGIPVIIVSSLEQRRGSGTGSAARSGRLRGEA